ncbi:AMP-activated serine/threonine-protein kinase regulatory subunit [Naganishia albida]|nr:AMP-activated serine/threonine-protein kinase regulatory subunit [Naganishia albida]
MSSTRSLPLSTSNNSAPIFATQRGGHATPIRQHPSSTSPHVVVSSQRSSAGHARLTHEQALESLRNFLHSQSSYDVFPVSFRLIVMDSALVVKKAVSSMLQNGVVSAPLWNSRTSSFAGMFTVSDIIHLIQYYYQSTSYEGAAADVERFRLESIRDIEKVLHVPPPPLLSVHPMKPLFDACRLLIQTHARRLPLIDQDDQTGKEVVLSVLTQYRVLKFMAVNCRETVYLDKSLRDLGIGTYVNPSREHPENPYYPLATATMQTTVFDVVHMFSELGISAVPIVDSQGKVINLYETVDVITLVRMGAYHDLDLTIAQALARRSTDFAGVVTCTPDDSLASVFHLIRMRRIHRLVIVEGGKPKAGETSEEAAVRTDRKGKLLGMISLSDVLKHIIGNVDIGGGGVGAVPVEAVLAAEAQARREQSA